MVTTVDYLLTYGHYTGLRVKPEFVQECMYWSVVFVRACRLRDVRLEYHHAVDAYKRTHPDNLEVDDDAVCVLYSGVNYDV